MFIQRNDAQDRLGASWQHEFQGPVRHYGPQIETIAAKWFVIGETFKVQAGACIRVD